VNTEPSSSSGSESSAATSRRHAELSASGIARPLFRGRRKLFWLVAVVLVGLDQVTKILYASTLVARAEQVQIIPGVLKFVDKLPNQQGVFGMGPSSPFFYAAATLLGLCLIAYFLLHLDPTRIWPHLGLGLLCGGALGNMVDRLVFSGVRDFIQMALWPFIYNVADAAICVGVFILITEAFFGPGPVSEKAD